MGNQPNHNADTDLINAHNLFTLDFVGGVPLFNIQDIQFPLSTQNIKIVDARGRRVKLAGGNWSGAHMCRHCVDGLECRPLRDIAMDIRYKFKMNCIRLTYSLQMFFQDKPVPQKYLKANPELFGKTGMQIFDITVQILTEVGLMVILNNHTSTSQWCCSNQDGDGLWWTRQFPEHMFFQCAEAFARRYKNNPRVIGMDLRNQLRKAHGIAPTWGDGNPLTDWKRAAKICADKVQDIAPHWLILVSGLDYQLDLSGVHTSPLTLKLPNKLVYTGHFYGFSWPQQQITTWKIVSYQAFKEKMFNTQTSVRALGYPYFLGEFGNNTKDIPWNYLIRYLKQTDIDWTYWALDGFKCEPKEDETYGVFTNDFSQARHSDLLQDMISTGPPPGTVIQRPAMRKQDNLQKNQNQQEIFNNQMTQSFIVGRNIEDRILTSGNNRYPNNERTSQNSNPIQGVPMISKMPILGGNPQFKSNPQLNNSPRLYNQYNPISAVEYQQQRQPPPQMLLQQQLQQQPPIQNTRLFQPQPLISQQQYQQQQIIKNQPTKPQISQNYVQNQMMGQVYRGEIRRGEQRLPTNILQSKLQGFEQQRPNYQQNLQEPIPQNQMNQGFKTNVNSSNALNFSPAPFGYNQKSN